MQRRLERHVRGTRQRNVLNLRSNLEPERVPVNITNRVTIATPVDLAEPATISVAHLRPNGIPDG